MNSTVETSEKKQNNKASASNTAGQSIVIENILNNATIKIKKTLEDYTTMKVTIYGQSN